MDVTPPLGSPLAGYFRDRFADGIISPIELNALAYSNGKETARYALLRKQFDYEHDQVSQWPKGELKEEVTYESTGIIPEE